MSKARCRAAASWRLLVGYSTRSTAPVRTMSLRVGLGLRSEGQHDGRHRSRCSQRGQPGHAGMAVEDRSGDEHAKGAQFLHLVDDVTTLALVTTS